jgi:hypothetical protein
LNIIKNQKVNRNNINIDNELQPNEAVIVCNHYIKEKLLNKGITFKEMYPGVFIVTSINGNSTLQNIDKISRVIRLCNSDLINEGDLVSQMSEKKMDTFFQEHFWSDRQKKKMHIKKVEYKGKEDDYEPGVLIVTYQEGKRGREFTFKFGDGWTQLLGYTEDEVRIEDVWDRYLFDETVKPWLEKNKFNLSLEVNNNSPITTTNSNVSKISRSIELEEK